MQDREPSFAQLCAIARRLLTAEPSIDDAEWKEQIKRALAQLRLRCPLPHVIVDAMDRAERAIARPSPLPSTPEPSPPGETGRELSQAEACAALAQLALRFKRPALKPRAMPPGESALMNTRERYRTVAQIEQLRELLRQRRALAATPKEIADE
jgi:hypothetical protein